MTIFVVLAVVGALVLLLAARTLLVLVGKGRFERYWQEGLGQLPTEGALRLVVLGDSISVGVGACSRHKTLVGRVAAYLEAQTGRAVHLQNYGRSGATADELLEQQLPQADLAHADVVMLEVGANDSRRRTPAQYEKAMKEILNKLPRDKTIIADVPGVKNREAYQAVLDRLLKDERFIRADIVRAFSGPGANFGVTAGDFFHPNNRGYGFWFRAFRPGIDQVLQNKTTKIA
jgi:acyl-CoA thioesterase-1